MSADRVAYTTWRLLRVFGVCVPMVLGGCQYRWGGVMHPQISSIAVGGFENTTRHPGLSAILRSKLSENLMRDGSVSLAELSDADSVVTGRISSVDLTPVASVRGASTLVRDSNQDQYQSAIYRVNVTVSYELRVPGYKTPLVSTQTVQGTADFSRLPDMRISREEALQTALNDAAVRMVSSITEAW